MNAGWLWAAGLLAVVGVFSLTSGWRMHVDEREALVAAQRAVGFPVGHASAQQVWRGLRSRPTWRVSCYSTEDPPTRRGLVLVDAVDGRVVEHLIEDNPERWAAGPPSTNRTRGAADAHRRRHRRGHRVTEAVERHVAAAGHDVVVLGHGDPWPDVGHAVGTAVVDGRAERGIVWLLDGYRCLDRRQQGAGGASRARARTPTRLAARDGGTTPTSWPSACG